MTIVLFVLKICLFLSITFVFAALGVAITIDVKKSYKSAEPLTIEDYIELRDRFGESVEFVVRDMITGKGERWYDTGTDRQHS